MYINDTHVLYYFFALLIGMIVGQFLDYTYERLQHHRKILSKELFTYYIKNMDLKLPLMYTTSFFYVLTIYLIGIRFDALLYLLLIPFLILIFILDIKKNIIPNRLTLSLFEIGIIFTFIKGFTNYNVFADNIIGCITGGLIFLVIALIGKLVSRKEAMGFGDVKLMGALGLILGFYKIIIVSAIAIVLAGITSIILLIFRKKKVKDYIPFGPFASIATILVMYLPYNELLSIILKLFSLGFYNS